VDLIGLGVGCALAGWSVVSAQMRGGSPRDYVGAIGLFAISYLVGRLAAARAAVVAVVVAGVFGAWVLTTGGAFSGGPLAGPLGYANANAALAVQVATVLLVAATRAGNRTARLLLALASLPVLSLAWFNDSLAAMIGGVALFAVALAILLKGAPATSTVAIGCCGLILGVAVVGQVLVASGVGSGVAARGVSERRVELWTDAVHLVRSQPVLGHGPLSFATESPTASADPDTRAAHSAVLQVAAELGLIGAGLLLLLTAWAYWTLTLAAPAPGIVGAIGWTALCLQALVDYVANYPMVLAAAGLALGLAVGPYSRRTSRSARHARRRGDGRSSADN
jgi:O-antigen ligase